MKLKLNKLLKIKGLSLFGDDGGKVPTIEQLQKQIEDIQKSVQDKDTEIANLKQQVEDEKKKNAQFTILGLQKPVQKPAEEEKVVFDFDF